MNRYRLIHVTEFQYDGLVSESYNELHLRPRQDDTQSCLSFRLTTEPAASTSYHVDYYDLLASSQYAPHVELLRELVHSAEQKSGGTLVGFVRAATEVVHSAFRYEKGASHGHSSILDSLASGAGVCQDFSHILLAVVRMRGVPGRYVSG